MPSENTELLPVSPMLRIPIAGRFIRNAAAEFSLYSTVTASKRLAKRYNVRLTVDCPRRTSDILNTSPCVIAFNHPYEIETFAALAALPPRPDVRMIVSANVLSILPDTAGVIPVWIDHHARREKKGKLSGKIVNACNWRPEYSPAEGHRRNVESIRRAASFVREGGIVLISPEGFRGKAGRWFSGIGHLIATIGADTHARYIACHISGTSNLDWFRVFPPLGRFLPEITVRFTEAIPIRTIIRTGGKPKSIAQHLESAYRDWAERHC